MPCTICQHPKRPEIDQALIAGSATLVALGQQYNLSTSALHRHKAHLQAKVGRTRDRLQDNLRQGGLFWLSQALDTTRQTAKAALAENNGKLALQAVRQGTRLLNILLKHDFHLDDRLVYEIVASPQWISQDCLLPDDPAILARSREYVAGPLSTSCPEGAALPLSAVSQADLDLLPQLLPDLLSPEKSGKTLLPRNSCAHRQPQDQKPAAENRLSKTWEKSGKLPGKTSLDKMISKENHRDKLKEKNTGKDPQSCSAGAWLDELAAGRLDFDLLTAIGTGRKLPEPLAVFQDALSPGTTETSRHVF